MAFWPEGFGGLDVFCADRSHEARGDLMQWRSDAAMSEHLSHGRHSVRRARWAFTVLALCVAGCDGGGSSAPTAPSATASSAPSATLNLTGTWRGTTSIGPEFIWRLTQNVGDVTGFSTLPGSPGFPWSVMDGRISGSVIESTVVMTEAFPAGSLSIPGCTLERQSTLQGTNNELRGPMIGSGCLGPGSVTVVVTRQ
jgi:hypothetical protein